jgi:hypothetical protein
MAASLVLCESLEAFITKVYGLDVLRRTLPPIWLELNPGTNTGLDPVLPQK